MQKLLMRGRKTVHWIQRPVVRKDTAVKTSKQTQYLPKSPIAGKCGKCFRNADLCQLQHLTKANFLLTLFP